MNEVFLIGNLTRDPELTTTPAGVDVCRFAIAVNRGHGDNQTADFYNVTAWRGLGETIAKYAKKGNKIAVIGDIQFRQYEANDGTKRLAVDVIAQSVEFLTPKQEQPAESERTPVQPAKPAKPVQQRMEAFDDDGDIPF